MKSPTNAKIFEALLDNIERGSPKTETQIAGELGYTLHGKPQPARIWKAKKALGKFLAEELGKNPRVLDRIWKLIELSKLDFGVNPLGRQAKVGHLIWSYLTQNPDPRI